MFLQQWRQLGLQKAVRCWFFFFLESCLIFLFSYEILGSFQFTRGAEEDCEKHYVPADPLPVSFIM